MDFPHLIYTGPPVNDPEILDRVPAELAAMLRERNGLVAWSGGFHLRGACLGPDWHALRTAWEGPEALHRQFEAVLKSDVPFGEEACGDQFLLREGRVLRLTAETDEVAEVAPDLLAFLAQVRDDGIRVLGLEPLLAFQEEGQHLQPGQLLSVYPPFCTAEARQGVTLKAVPSAERLRFLAALARQLKDVPDGASVEIWIEP